MLKNMPKTEKFILYLIKSISIIDTCITLSLLDCSTLLFLHCTALLLVDSTTLLLVVRTTFLLRLRLAPLDNISWSILYTGCLRNDRNSVLQFAYLYWKGCVIWSLYLHSQLPALVHYNFYFWFFILLLSLISGFKRST